MKIIISESQFDSVFLGERVMVYYNLHKHTFSITHSGKVIMHADVVKLSDVEFRVRHGGRERVRDEKRKNVHAFVIGTLEDYCEFPCDDIEVPEKGFVVSYDPYKNETFVIKKTQEPVFDAKFVEMVNSKNKIYITK